MIPTRPRPLAPSAAPAMFNVESLERAELGESLLTWVSALAARPPPGAGPPGKGHGTVRPRPAALLQGGRGGPRSASPAPARAAPWRSGCLQLGGARQSSSGPAPPRLAAAGQAVWGLPAAGGLCRLSSASAPRKQRNRHGAAGRAGGVRPGALPAPRRACGRVGQRGACKP